MGQKSLIFITILIIITVAFSVIFVVSRLISDNRGSDNKGDDGKVESTLTDPQDILDTPIVFENKHLEIEAEMFAWVTKDSFTLLSGDVGGPFDRESKQLWVIFGEDFDLPHKTDESIPGFGELKKVKVKGFSRILNREEMERLLNNGLDDPKLFLDGNKIATGWDYGIVIVGESVEIVD